MGFANEFKGCNQKYQNFFFLPRNCIRCFLFEIFHLTLSTRLMSANCFPDFAILTLFFISPFQNSPYTMLKENHEELVGNDKYEGYCIDLLKEVSKVLGFKFHIKLVDDNKYGEKNDQGEWNGMIKELINGVTGQ